MQFAPCCGPDGQLDTASASLLLDHQVEGHTGTFLPRHLHRHDFLADEAGVSPRTIGRLEKGQGVSVDTFIRVLMALGIQQNLEALLPDPTVRPIERIDIGGGERKRARPGLSSDERAKWSWGDGEDSDE